MMPGYEFDIEFAGPPSWATMYRAQGIHVVPAWAPGEHAEWKRPKVEWKEFTEAGIPDFTFERWYGPNGQFSRRQNMGMITGVNGLWVIDTDTGRGKRGEEIWQAWLITHNNGMDIETPTQRTGGGGRQRIFRAPDTYTPPTFKTPDGLDSRGHGGFAMLPPSKHESGQEYAWEPGLGPWEVEIAPAPEWLMEEGDKLSKSYPGAARGPAVEIGQEQNAFGLTVDGREERMRNIIWGVACDLKRELGDASPVDHPRAEAERARAWGLYLFEVKTTLAGLDNETGLEREGRGISAFMERWIRALGQWEGKLATEAARPKPEPRPKDEAAMAFDPWARADCPPFPLDRLPASLAAYMEAQAASLGADQAGVVMAALTAISGGLDQRFRAKMRRYGDWYEPPRLWTILVGGSGIKKTPIIGGAIKPLVKLEYQWAHERRVAYARYQAAKDAGEPAVAPGPATRLILNDTTKEAAGALLAQQPRGILMVNDEMSGFFESFDRYANGRSGGDRAFWLAAHEGGEHHVDRKTAGESFIIENLCVASLGGIQPARLRELGRLDSDGLLQRFNPVMLRRAGLSCELDSDDKTTVYGNVLTYLAHMKPQAFRMADEALALAEEFRRELWEIGNAFEDEDSGFAAWLAKLEGTHGSLSLILHILEDKENCAFLEIGRRSVQGASEICRDFLIPHARAFYDEVMGEAGLAEQRRIAGYLLTAPKTRFTYSDLRFNAKVSTAKNLLEMTFRLTPFVEAGWLAEDGIVPNVRAWELAPWVRERFAIRREDELKRRSQNAGRFKRRD